MRNYFSTRLPVSSSIQASGNSEQWKMTGQADNVGFLATGSGVQQIQLSLGGWFVLKCHSFSPKLMSTKLRSTNIQAMRELRLLLTRKENS